MKRFFIGDIHGCADELEELISKLDYTHGIDQMYSVGDVINKGPDSPRVLDIIEEYSILTVLGNHEQLFLDTYETPKNERTNKQSRFMKQFHNKEDRCYNQIKKWPLYRILDDIILVHAGLEPGNRDPESMGRTILTTIRTWDGTGAHLNNPSDPKWYECDIWEQKIIFGHWAKNGLVISNHFIGLDSGCVYGGALTAYCPENEVFYSAPSQQPKRF